MRIIVEVFHRVWGVEISALHVRVSGGDEEESGEEVQHLGMDPHSTTSAHIERRSDIEDAYGHGHTAKVKPAFGFAVGVHGTGS
jgi:hypothetical protein